LQKYRLLAYLQEVNRHFGQNRLYPQLSDIIFHYNNLISFRDNKKLLQDNFPKQLDAVNVQQLELTYKKMLEDDELMQELEEIINYSASTIRTTIKSGTEIYEFVEDKLIITPVGLIPLDTHEGYFFLSNGGKSTRVYYYRLSFFEKHDEKYRSMKTAYVNSWDKNFINTFESIKSELIKYRSQLPNPAVYAIQIELGFPVEETLLPVAKRSLVKYISTKAA
jgi:hypothetical protein